jgi:hypothetical protein
MMARFLHKRWQTNYRIDSGGFIGILIGKISSKQYGIKGDALIKRVLTASLTIPGFLIVPASSPAALEKASHASPDSPLIQVAAAKKKVSRRR